jgi:hypothetical protein
MAICTSRSSKHPQPFLESLFCEHILVAIDTGSAVRRYLPAVLWVRRGLAVVLLIAGSWLRPRLVIDEQLDRLPLAGMFVQSKSAVYVPAACPTSIHVGRRGSLLRR